MRRRSEEDAPVDRRTLLGRAGTLLGSALALAGCTTDALSDAERPPPALDHVHVETLDLPVTQPLGVAAAGIERVAAAAIDSPSAFAAVLEDEGLGVSDVHESTVAGEAVMAVYYTPPDGDDGGLMGHLGVVAGATAALVDAGHDARTLDATVVADGEPFGTYEIERAWAEAFLDGGSARAYAAEVAETVETV